MNVEGNTESPFAASVPKPNLESFANFEMKGMRQEAERVRMSRRGERRKGEEDCVCIYAPHLP